MSWILIEILSFLGFLGLVMGWYTMRDVAEKLVSESAADQVEWKLRRPNASDRSLFGPS